jgi:molybdopterin-binding protein
MEVVGHFQPGEKVLLCVRPEDITLSPPRVEDSKSSARNRLEGTVVKIIPWGSHYRLELDCGGCRLVVFISRPYFLEGALQEGKKVIASFKETDIHVIKGE